MSQILIVDDNEQNRYMLESALKGVGHEVVCASQGAEALAAARKAPPELVITDILMPVMDGFELCRLWKADARLKLIPFIFYTATYTEPKDQQFGLSLGADRFIVKPAHVEVLQRAVGEVLEEARQGKAGFPAQPKVPTQENLIEYNEVVFRKLQKKVAELEEARAAKDDFLAIVSHELRTPLTAIQGWAWLLRSGDLPQAEREQALDSILRNIEAQRRTIDDLIDVASLCRGGFRQARETVDLGSVLESVCAALEPVARSQGQRFDRDLRGPVTVLGDAARLEQVFCQLLHNAIKFTPENGRISVSLLRAADHAEVTVQDDGSGIPTEFLPHVFEAFRQAESPLTRQHGGLGLGLALVKHLVEGHGGTVSAESPGPGRGATFRVRLPAGS